MGISGLSLRGQQRSEWIILQEFLYREDTPKQRCECKTDLGKDAVGSADGIFQSSTAERRWSCFPLALSHSHPASCLLHLSAR